jgi:hypothetical protein
LFSSKKNKVEGPMDGNPASYTYSIPILLIENVEFKNMGEQVRDLAH